MLNISVPSLRGGSSAAVVHTGTVGDHDEPELHS
jgi:hypothetical protein